MALGILLLLGVLAAGGVGLFGYEQYPALNTVGERFCNDLLTQNYDDGYHLLSARLRSQFSRDTFASMGQTLDTFQGNVVSCGQQSLEHVQVGLFPISLTVASTMTRQKSGLHQGPVRIVYEQGAWKVDDLSSSLLGISPDALAVALTWCDDTSRYNYVGIWSLYGNALQSQDSKSAVAQLHVQPQAGSVPAPMECTLTALNVSSDQHRVSVTFEITTTSQVVNATLGQEDGHWRITAMSPDQLGQMIAANKTTGPATAVASKWLYALANGDCSSSYAMLTSDAQQRISLSSFTSQVCLAWDWNAVVSDGVYTQSAAQTTIKIEFRGFLPSATPVGLLGPNGVVGLRPSAEVILVQEYDSWKIEGLQPL